VDDRDFIQNPSRPALDDSDAVMNSHHMIIIRKVPAFRALGLEWDMIYHRRTTLGTKFELKLSWLRWLPIFYLLDPQFPVSTPTRSSTSVTASKFLPQSVLAIPLQPNGAMQKWILQLDSAHQIGPETTLKGFLIVVGSWSAVG